jgi:hypothetical protein
VPRPVRRIATPAYVTAAGVASRVPAVGSGGTVMPPMTRDLAQA